MSSTRQLAAIMFTDIVGYTALMGEDEDRALELLQINRELHTKLVANHSGKFLKEMGDGILASFNSVLEAVDCALEIQAQVKDYDGLSLRIGIHLGDVVIQDGDVFGDGVNIASRIQQKAPRGTIYVSEAVRKNLLNKRGLLMEFVGKDTLKNVREPVAVYAVSHAGDTMPSGKKIGYEFQRKWLISVAFIIGLLLIWWLFPKLSNDKIILSEGIRESRIAVLPFQNNTNDPELDMLGDMAADWIIQGLMDIREVKVVSFQTVKDNIQYASLGKTEKSYSLFKDRTGAEKIIRGNIYLQGEELIVKSQIIDLASGELEIALSDISGKRNDLSAVVALLSQRIQGYFADDMGRVVLSPPTFEAFKYFRVGLTYYGWNPSKTLENFSKAIQADSTYLQPYIWTGLMYNNQGEFVKVDSVIMLIENKFDRFNRFEQLMLDWLKAANLGDGMRTYEILKEMFEIDLKNFVINYQMGVEAKNLNKPGECLQYYNLLNPENIETEFRWMSWWYANYAYCLVRLNQAERALEVLDYVPDRLQGAEYYTARLLVHAMIHSEDSISLLIDQVGKAGHPENWITQLNIEAANRYALVGNAAKSKKYARMAIDQLKDLPVEEQRNFAGAWYFAEKYNKAMSLYKQANVSIGQEWAIISRIGACYARLGNRESALKVIDELLDFNHPHLRARNNYGVARIYVALNQPELAMDYLNQAFSAGFGPSYFLYDLDPDLLILHDHPDFQQFLHPTE